MATNVVMPSLGFDMTEGKLLRWLKKPGERVEKGQAIAEIETEKATVEIEASAPGTLQKIIVPADQTVPVGTVIAVIAEAGEQAPASSTPGTSLPAAKPETMRSKSAPAAPKKTERAETPRDGGDRVKVSPIAKRMAEQAGIDLHSIQGSGPGGRIMERDVQSAIDQTDRKRNPTAAVATPAPTATQPEQPTPASESVTLSKMRQTIARRMTESKTTIPHFYVTIEIDMTQALMVREQLNALTPDDEKISVNDLLVAAAARVLVQFPVFNSSFHDGKLERHPQVNIGIAVALEDGLLTPVVRDADKKSLKEIAQDARGLGERARGNKLRADDLGGASFTVSNLGMFGVDEFVAIINPPEAAILAVGQVAKRPVVTADDELHIAPLLKATISVDHRVADGAQAARFMQALKKLLENPLNLLVTG